MRENKLIELYRKLVNQSSLEAPEEVWQNISGILDASSKAKTATGAPADQDSLEDAWAGISTQLDIDEVWNNVSAELDRDKKVLWLSRPVWRDMAAAIIMLLAIGSVIYLLLPVNLEIPQHTHVVTTDTVEEADTLKNPVALRDSPVPFSEKLVAAEVESYFKESGTGHTASSLEQADTPLKGQSSQVVTAKVPASQQKTGTGILASDGSEGHIETSGEAEVLEFARRLPLPMLEAGTRVNSTPRLDAGIAFSMDPLQSDFAHDFNPLDVTNYNRKDSRWTLGIISAIKNTYLLNQKTFDGFKPDNLRDSRMVFMPDMGINAKYAIHKKLILDMNIFLSSATRQAYSEYVYGKYESTSTELKYLLTEFSIKHNASRSFLASEKLIRRNVAGFYLANLQDAIEDSGPVSLEVNDQYASFDYGVLVGQEFEIKTHSPLKITAGLTAKYGLKNVFEGSAEIPAGMHRTHNASVEFRLGIAWRFKSGNPADYYLGWLGR